MRDYSITCDICGKLLQPKGDLIPPFKTVFNSVELKLIYSERNIQYDLCPKCMKRMERYLKKQAKTEDKHEAD